MPGGGGGDGADLGARVTRVNQSPATTGLGRAWAASPLATPGDAAKLLEVAVGGDDDGTDRSRSPRNPSPSPAAARMNVVGDDLGGTNMATLGTTTPPGCPIRGDTAGFNCGELSLVDFCPPVRRPGGSRGAEGGVIALEVGGGVGENREPTG
mmetsp:Transcript_30388/g.80758  ORF Transcript_30388/g.80758 Transcript_30388/m.80758 type:complete len:153 (-) Transcript_30388:1674-2132(-)